MGLHVGVNFVFGVRAGGLRKYSGGKGSGQNTGHRRGREGQRSARKTETTTTTATMRKFPELVLRNHSLHPNAFTESITYAYIPRIHAFIRLLIRTHSVLHAVKSYTLAYC